MCRRSSATAGCATLTSLLRRSASAAWCCSARCRASASRSSCRCWRSSTGRARRASRCSGRSATRRRPGVACTVTPIGRPFPVSSSSASMPRCSGRTPPPSRTGWSPRSSDHRAHGRSCSTSKRRPSSTRPPPTWSPTSRSNSIGGGSGCTSPACCTGSRRSSSERGSTSSSDPSTPGTASRSACVRRGATPGSRATGSARVRPPTIVPPMWRPIGRVRHRSKRCRRLSRRVAPTVRASQRR